MIGNVSNAPTNKDNAAAKARIIVQELGYKENPVVAEYFRAAKKGHFSAIRQYRNIWQTYVTVNVKTVDDTGEYDRYYSLDSVWILQAGVFSLVNK